MFMTQRSVELLNNMGTLPPPIPGCVGWPWVAGNPPLPPSMPPLEGIEVLDAVPWPRVTIVTPSYNQAQFIEETIRSVLLQGYPNLEYIIIDGGSSDGSVEIIRRYEPWLAYWVSEPDRGQSHALNKGFARATGDVLAWLNSDDVYQPGAIGQAVQALHSQNGQVVYANCRFVDADGRQIRLAKPPPVTQKSLIRYWYPDQIPPQPSMFFTSEAFRRAGPLAEDLCFAMDYDLWLRLIQNSRFVYVDAEWSIYRVHATSKTNAGWDNFEREWYRISRSYWHSRGLGFLARCFWDHRRDRLAPACLDRAFEAYQEGNWPAVRALLAQALLFRPEYLRNRGVRSVAFQSIFGPAAMTRIKRLLHNNAGEANVW